MSNKSKTTGILLAALSFVFLSACSSSKSEQKPLKPNIIFIMADDLGYGDLGCYGQQIIRTPNLDHMAAEGMRFTQFYAGSTVCAPSRASLMTGQHTGHTHVRGNGEYPLLENDTIIPQLLRQQGYVTAMFGKWGLGLKGTAGAPQKKGWDHFMGHLHHVEAHYQQPDSMWRLENDNLIPFATPEGSYGNELFTREAVKFLNSHSGEEPFFMYLSFTLPHAELLVPEKYLQPYLNEDGGSKFAPETTWPAGKHYGPQPYPKAAYAAMVSSVDDYVGQVLEQLKKQGLDKNTLVIFTGDNGTHIEGGRRQKDVDFFKSSGPYRGTKRDLYEGGIREPFIAYWPAKIKAGSASDHIGAFWDILPTLGELTGASVPAGIDGISFLPALMNREGQQQHEYLYWEFHEKGGKQAVRKGKWKAVKLDINKNPDTPIELYDLSNGPAEQNNIADRNPDIVSKMEKIMKEARTPNPIFKFPFDQ